MVVEAAGGQTRRAPLMALSVEEAEPPPNHTTGPAEPASRPRLQGGARRRALPTMAVAFRRGRRHGILRPPSTQPRG
ncbi:MAG: hypothetical protein M5R40_17940 [Anaerolineae bacterium]|nr:hypothetical protein [Anaerolineae bacterium]